MKSIIITVACLISITTSLASTLIVSDVDDTIKITNVLSKPELIINGLFKKNAFSGMSELYQKLNSSDTVIYYVSGSPHFIKEKVYYFLEFNHFPEPQNLLLKKGSISTYDFKLASIRDLIKKYNPDKVILLGDDTELDPEVYDTLTKDAGARVEAIYIRAIRNRKLPNNILMKSFFSSVEVAVFELLKGNILPEGLKEIAVSFIDQTNYSKIVIKHRYCPAEGRVQIEELKQRVTDQLSIELLDLVQKKIIKTCKKDD